MKKVLFFNIFFALTLNIFSQEKNYKFPPVKYISLIDDLSQYYFYANGGFNADWYIGYNNAWIVNLGSITTSGYEKAFIGVKIGRAKNKTYPTSEDPSPIEGRIVVSISQKPEFPAQAYFLVDSSDIPMEPLQKDNIKNVDGAKWFWAEIPINKISSETDNYVAVWSQSKSFTDSSNSPIIAAGFLSDNKENVWLNHSISGALPPHQSALETPIYGIKPAIVIKLIAQNDYKVIIKNFSYELKKEKFIFNWNTIGTDVYKNWFEISYDKLEWQKYTPNIYNPPYFYSFKKEELPKDIFYLRVCAADIFENKGCSNPVNINLLKKE